MMINELILSLCDEVEELELMADTRACGKTAWKNETKLIHSEAYYRAKASGINRAIVIACRIRDKRSK